MLKKQFKLTSFCLMLFCLGLSLYSLYASRHNLWLIAPPNYVIFVLSVSAFVLGIMGYRSINWRGKLISWLTVAMSLLLSLVLLFVMLLSAIFSVNNSPILTTHSPDNKYTIDFYRWDAGAMGTFGVRGELNGPLWFKKRIYYQRRVETVEVDWITDHTVSINDHMLNLDKGDSYGIR